jgi:hypothetical protein
VDTQQERNIDGVHGTRQAEGQHSRPVQATMDRTVRQRRRLASPKHSPFLPETVSQAREVRIEQIVSLQRHIAAKRATSKATLPVANGPQRCLKYLIRPYILLQYPVGELDAPALR